MSNYYITIAFYSEPNRKGNLWLYYLKGIKGNKIAYGGTASKKLYCQKHAAMKAAEKAKACFTTAVVTLHEIDIVSGGIKEIVEM